MNAAKDSIRVVNELAARWTEPALELLAASGVHGVSVSMELDIWRTLKNVMHLALRRQQSLPLVTMRLDAFRKQVLLAAMLRVAGKYVHSFDIFALEGRLRSWIGRQPVQAADLWLYAQMTRDWAAQRPATPPQRSGYRIPRLSAVVG